MKRIPEEIRIQQINALPNTEFIRWADGYSNNKSKAVVRCRVDGHEWVPTVQSLIAGSGCPQCYSSAPRPSISEKERIRQINSLPNILFIRWLNGYTGAYSKAVCRCLADGFEWSPSVNNLINNGSKCPQCANNRRYTAQERIDQINAIPNIEFVRWAGKYKDGYTRVVCRCAVDGSEWATTVGSIVNGHGCHQCALAARAVRARTPADERVSQINSRPNIYFIRWENGYTNWHSKAVCRCKIDGFEWAARVGNLIGPNGTGCPVCAAGGGYDPKSPGTLYILRSECGSMVKIGISNKHEQRHAQLRRATPFNWHCIELLHSDDGSLIAEFEKELHNFTEPATFRETFDGYTEWRKWDNRLPMWIKRHRARLERYNKAP